VLVTDSIAIYRLMVPESIIASECMSQETHLLWASHLFSRIDCQYMPREGGKLYQKPTKYVPTVQISVTNTFLTEAARQVCRGYYPNAINLLATLTTHSPKRRDTPHLFHRLFQLRGPFKRLGRSRIIEQDLCAFLLFGQGQRLSCLFRRSLLQKTLTFLLQYRA
jgi:hypothetical protein